MTPFAAHLVGESRLGEVSRELSSIFIPSKKDYNSPAATFSNLFLRPTDRPTRSSVVARRRERRQLRRLVTRLHSLTFPRGRMDGRGVVVEVAYLDMQESFSQRRRKANAAHRLGGGGSLSNQLLIQYSFLRDITFHLHAPCPIPGRPFALFVTSLSLHLLRFLLFFFLPVTAFSTSELSYPRPDRGVGKCRHVLHNIEIF